MSTTAPQFVNRTWSKTHVPVAPFRERFLVLRERGEVSAQGLARDLGWFRKPSPADSKHRRVATVPDGGRVTRQLGLRDDICRGYRYRRQYVNFDLAERLCELLRLDPWEVGI